MVSCDGVDFKIQEHGPNFPSHKFAKKSGLRYEICLCIRTGDLVWVNGPFPCGNYPDISIFRSSLMSHLEEFERVEADDGYIGEHPQYIKCPKGVANPEETKFMQSRVRSRQETINNRFKNWGILRQRYRHDIQRHGVAARSVMILTQLSIDNGDKLFSCGYRDPPYGNFTNTAYDVDPADADDEE